MKNTVNKRNSQNSPQMDAHRTSNSRIKTIGKSLLHVFLYLVLLTILSVSMNAQCTLPCYGHINIPMNEDCEVTVVPSMILSDNGANCPGGFLTVMVTFPDGTPVPGSPVITSDYANQTLHVKVTDSVTGHTCWGELTVVDYLGPVLNGCDYTQTYGFGTVNITCLQYEDGTFFPTPTFMDACDAGGTIMYSDEHLGMNCASGFSNIIIRTYTATDINGNESICKLRIQVSNLDVNDVMFPPPLIDTVRMPLCTTITSFEPEDIEAIRPGFGLPKGVTCPNIMYSYTDIGVEQCGQMVIKFLRKWTVIDWCSGDSRTANQVIKIKDIDPPVFTCLKDTVFVNALPYACEARVTLDPFALIDSLTAAEFIGDCSNPVKANVSFYPATLGAPIPTTTPFIGVAEDANGVFPVPGLINEAIWVRYCFTDECGNSNVTTNVVGGVEINDYSNCCNFVVAVKDTNKPTAICEGFTKVPLESDGNVEVFAETFDDHSFDACGSIVDYLVRRTDAGCGEDLLFEESVNFCCADLNKNIIVELKVIDEEGNESVCPAMVCLVDYSVPEANCPNPNVQITCRDDYRTHDLGDASGVNGCDENLIIGDSEYNLAGYNADCNTGVVIRTIKIYDLDNTLLKTCQQTITIVPSGSTDILKPGDYLFPLDATVDVCMSNSIHPDKTGFPVARPGLDLGCANIAILYEDSPPLESNSNSVCYTILRKWKVIDWCKYDPDYPDAHVLHGQQQITVENTGTPTLQCPSMVMVSTTSADCMGHVDINTVVGNACGFGNEVHWEMDLGDNGSIDVVGTGNNASGSYPVGSHSIEFTVYNECGGGANRCEFPVVIKGERPPIPLCYAAVTWTISEDTGEAVVWASDYDIKSIGGCDGEDNLMFSFVSPEDPSYPQTSMTFDCGDIPNGISESIILVVYVVDESLNYESCTVILNLQDNNMVCPDSGTITTLGGMIMTEMEQAVEDVMVHLDNMTDENNTMNMTTSLGSYAFTEVEYYDDYRIKPEHDVEDLNGVSTKDLVMIQRHILGLEPLTSPYKLIAADINKDNEINGLDLVELRKLILGVVTEFPQNDSWVFVKEDYEFSDPSMPWGYDDRIDIYDLYLSDMSSDFVAVKVGDVDNSAIVNMSSTTSSRKSSTFYLSAPEYSFKAGELVEVPFVVEEESTILGMQFTLEFDYENLIFQGIDGMAMGITSNNFSLRNDHDGIITISIDVAEAISLERGDILFAVYFESRDEGAVSKMIGLQPEILDSEVYTDDKETHDLEFVVRNVHQNTEGAELEVFQNQPNPFTQETRISFYLSESQNVKSTIFDSNGKVLVEQHGFYKKGFNELMFDSEEYNASGILFYRLESGTTTVTKKMISLK